MSKKFQLNIAMFNKSGEMNSIFSHLFSNQENMLALRNTQILPYFSQISLPQNKYDLNLFKAVGFGKDFSKWQTSLQSFLAQQDFKTAPIEQWLHGAFYFIDTAFSREDEEALLALHKAAIPVYIILCMPKAQSETIRSVLEQKFPYPVADFSAEMRFDLLLNRLLMLFNLSLKGKVVMGVSEFTIQTFTRGRQEIKDALERMDLNLVSLIKNRANIEEEFEKEFYTIKAFDGEDLDFLSNNISVYIKQFENTFNITVDKTISIELESFFQEGEKILEGLDLDSYFEDIEKKFKGDFGDNILAIWKMIKFSLNIKEGIFNIFDNSMFKPIIELAEKLKRDYQNNPGLLESYKNGLEMKVI